MIYNYSPDYLYHQQVLMLQVDDLPNGPSV